MQIGAANYVYATITPLWYDTKAKGERVVLPRFLVALKSFFGWPRYLYVGWDSSFCIKERNRKRFPFTEFSLRPKSERE